MARSPHERALKAGLDATRRSHGVDVTYSRGASTLTVSRALQGDTFKTSIEVSGAEQVVETQQWLIGVADMGTLAPPQVGDLIKRTIDGTEHVFSVEGLNPGVAPWDWSDTGKTQYEIQTRKDGAAAFEVTNPSGFDLAGEEIRAE